MIHYFIRAFLDNYNEINVEVDKTFCNGQSKQFYLVDGAITSALTKVQTIDKGRYVSYKLNSGPLTIGKDYYVMGENGYRTPLIYRYIVKTAQFNQDYFYDGDDLGSVVKDQTTSFKLWAPTANNVEVVIEGKYYQMHLGNRGVYSLVFKGDLTGKRYHYLVKVNGEVNECLDPYGKASMPESSESVVVKYEAASKVKMPKPLTMNENIIYETSVADYSEEGTFKGLTANIDYLADLGITHLQLLPVNDFGSVFEQNKNLFYNWGYDPVQYMVLEGSYSSAVNNPLQVLADFKELVKELHEHQIRLNLDVVFNHHYAADRSCFEKSVPYYYYRFENGKYAQGSGCGAEFDTALSMCRKYFIDVLTYYVDCFDVDGFRFDLMGFIDVKTMQEMTTTLRKMKPNIMLYGEGWNMKADSKDQQFANMANYDKFSYVGFFNDAFRDVIKGNTFESKAKGYATGAKEYVEDAKEVLLSKRFKDVNRSINYAECHDDMTCFDKLKVCLPEASEDKLIQRQKLILGCVLLSQGVSFIHGGQEFCLSKNRVSNTYNGPANLNKLTSSKKEQYEDVIEYVKELVSLKKNYHLNQAQNISITDQNMMLIYKLDNLTVLINPGEDEETYAFEGCQKVIFADEGLTYLEVNDAINVEPLSLMILESAN